MALCIKCILAYFFIFLSFFTRNCLQDQPLLFLVNATSSVTSLHTYTEGNEDGFTNGNEDGNKDSITDGNEDGNKDGITDGNEDGITDGNEVGTAVNVGVLECVTLGALLVGDEGILLLKLKLLSLGIDVGTLMLLEKLILVRMLMLLMSCTKRDLGLVKKKPIPYRWSISKFFTFNNFKVSDFLILYKRQSVCPFVWEDKRITIINDTPF